MRKCWIIVLALLMAACMLFGCGKKQDPAAAAQAALDKLQQQQAEQQEPPKAEPAPAPKPEPEKAPALFEGYWVLEGMVMEGSEFSMEDIEGIFGPAQSVAAFLFTEDGRVSGSLFDEPIMGDYTGDFSAFEMTFMGQKATGKGADKAITIDFGDGMVLTLKNQADMPEAIQNNPWKTYDPNFDANETMKMSNFMAFGRYLVVDDVLYGLSHASSNNGGLAATPFTLKGTFPEFEEPKMLDESGPALYLTMEGGKLYYCMNYESICWADPAGNGGGTLYQGGCDYLSVHGGRLYFTDENYHYVSTDMNGGDFRTELEKEIYFPYFIGEDWLLYQDDADGESLHIYNLSTGDDLNVNNEISYNPILDGSYLYYVDADLLLNRIDMSDPSTFLHEQSEKPLLDTWYQIDEEKLVGTNNRYAYKADWKDLTDDSSEVEELQMYTDDTYTVYHEFDSEGLISGKYLMGRNTAGSTSFK